MLTLLRLIKNLHLPLSFLPVLRSTIQFADHFYYLPKDVILKKLDLAGVPAEKIFLKERSYSKIIFYLHGGAFVVGMNCLYRQFGDTLTHLTQAAVILIDYSVAPENPFPIGLEQCITAYQALLAQGVSENDIIFMGDSAGGGLVLSTLLAARDRKIPLPKAAIVFSPWVDLTLSNNSIHEKEPLDPVIPVDRMSEVVSLYVKDQSPSHPLVSPLFADLESLPPLFIALGTHEVLCEEGQLLAQKARDAGVPVTLDIAEGMIHVYPILLPQHPQSVTVLEKIKNYIDQSFAKAG